MTNPQPDLTTTLPAATTPDAPPAASAAAAIPDPATTAPDSPTPVADEDPAGGNGEAARYRVKLREAESERDALAERLAAMQRHQCEAVSGQLLEVAADLWEIGGADPSAFYDEDGLLNETELRAAVGALLDQRPRLAKNPPTKPHQWGQHGDTPTRSAGASWADVIGQ